MQEPPEARVAHQRRLDILVVCLLTAAIAAPTLSAPMRLYDGGIVSSSATFTLHGQLAYRDYWIPYGPLSGWLLALPLSVFGPSVALSRVAGLLTLVAQALGAYWLIGRRLPGPPAVLLAVGSSVMLTPFVGLEVLPWPMAMAFALWGLAAAESRRPLVAGLLLGLAFGVRLDVGGYALLGALFWPNRVHLLAGFTAAVAPVAVLALATTPLDRLYEQLIWFPIVGTREFRVMPGPAFTASASSALLVLFLLLIPRAAIVAGVIEAARGRATRGLMAMVVFAALCQLQTLSRADPAHFVQAATPAVVLIGYLIEPWRRWGRTVGLATGSMFVGLGLLGLGYLTVPNDGSDAQMHRAVAAVRASTGREDPIYVGLTDHRYTILNPLIAYYLADRPPGTRTTMFNPGITDTADRQGEMAAELEASGVEMLILDRRYLPLESESAERQVPGSTRLDEYIAANFDLACDYDPIIVMRRRERPEIACP